MVKDVHRDVHRDRVLFEHRLGHLAARLRDHLKSAVAEESSDQLRKQFNDLLVRL
jgi:hypothetical protein